MAEAEVNLHPGGIQGKSAVTIKLLLKALKGVLNDVFISLTSSKNTSHIIKNSN